jgi:hypothetical protein
LSLLTAEVACSSSCTELVAPAAEIPSRSSGGYQSLKSSQGDVSVKIIYTGATVDIEFEPSFGVALAG